MFEDYSADVEFFLVYIREAHAIDGRSPIGGNGAPIVEEPISLAERFAVAQTCLSHMSLEGIPALIDQMDDRAAWHYQAFPDRLYLIGKSGKVAYRGARGPFGFLPHELEAAIQRELP